MTGIRSERNASISTRKVSPTTTAIISGSLAPIFSARSMYPAVCPPTNAFASVPATALGITVSRRWLTRSSVWLADGAVVATAVNTAAVPLGAIVGGVTLFTPGVVLTAWVSAVRRGSVDGSPPGWAGCAGVPNSTAISSGPLAPAPNPWVSASYDCRDVVDLGMTL